MQPKLVLSLTLCCLNHQNGRTAGMGYCSQLQMHHGTSLFTEEGGTLAWAVKTLVPQNSVAISCFKSLVTINYLSYIREVEF